MNTAHFLNRYCPRALLIGLVCSMAAFTIVCLLWVPMAWGNFATWAWLFKWSLVACVVLAVLCYFGALAGHAREVIFPRTTAIVRVDVNACAHELARKAIASAHQRRYTREETAKLLFFYLETHRHEFASAEQEVMRDIVARSIEILQGVR